MAIKNEFQVKITIKHNLFQMENTRQGSSGPVTKKKEKINTVNNNKNNNNNYLGWRSDPTKKTDSLIPT